MSTASPYNFFGTYPLSIQELQINKITFPDKIEQNSEENDYAKAFSDIIQKLLGFSIEESEPSPIQKTLSKIKSFNITIINERDVSDYLTKHQDIIELVPTIVEITKKYTDNETKLYLHVYHEYDFDDEYLTLLIRQQEYNDNIIEILNNIWGKYQKLLVGKSGSILVTTDFDIPE